MKIWYGFFLSMVALFLGLGLVNSTSAQAHIPAPTIVDIEVRAEMPDKPLIKGVTFNNTLVDIYIDDVFDGEAVVVNGNEGVASFVYEPFASFDAGEHEVYAVAKSLDKTVKSINSEKSKFGVSHPTPAPVLFDPILDEAGKMTIIGLSKNDLEVEIYIEGTLQVKFTPPAAKSGTTNFWYKPGLPAGEYTVTAKTIDNTGKSSIISNSVVMHVPKTGEVVMEEQVEEIEDIKEEVMEELKEEEPVVEEVKEEPIVQSDELEEKTVAEIEEKLPDEPQVIEPDTEDTTIVVDAETNDKGTVVIEQAEEIGEIVLDTGKDDLAIVTKEEMDEVEEVMEEPKEEDLIIFGEEKEGEEIGEGAEEVTEEDTADQIQQRNRVTGFIILLVIAVVLAVWYVREKKQAEKLEKGEKVEDNK